MTLNTPALHSCGLREPSTAAGTASAPTLHRNLDQLLAEFGVRSWALGRYAGRGAPVMIGRPHLALLRDFAARGAYAHDPLAARARPGSFLCWADVMRERLAAAERRVMRAREAAGLTPDRTGTAWLAPAVFLRLTVEGSGGDFADLARHGVPAAGAIAARLWSGYSAALRNIR